MVGTWTISLMATVRLMTVCGADLVPAAGRWLKTVFGSALSVACVVVSNLKRFDSRIFRAFSSVILSTFGTVTASTATQSLTCPPIWILALAGGDCLVTMPG
jgi:hypothetical protein